MYWCTLFAGLTDAEIAVRKRQLQRLITGGGGDDDDKDINNDKKRKPDGGARGGGAAAKKGKGDLRNRLADSARPAPAAMSEMKKVGPGRYCPLRHPAPCTLADIAPCVIECHSTRNECPECVE